MNAISRVGLAGCGFRLGGETASASTIAAEKWLFLLFLFGESVELGLQVGDFLLGGAHVELLGVDLRLLVIKGGGAVLVGRVIRLAVVGLLVESKFALEDVEIVLQSLQIVFRGGQIGFELGFFVG